MFKAWSEHSANVDSKLSALVTAKPIHKPTMGSTQTGGVAPASLILPCQTHPASGRVWNVLSVSIFGNDDHTAVAGAIAAIYGGELSPSGSVTPTPGPMSDLILTGATIPNITFVPDKAVWLHEMESIYAIIYTPPINTQFVLTARVGEYPVEAVEGMVV